MMGTTRRDERAPLALRGFLAALALAAVAGCVPSEGGEASANSGTPSSAGEAESAAQQDVRAQERLAQWRRQRGGDWVEQETEMHRVEKPADNSDLIGDPQGHQYGTITEQKVALWERETYKMAVEGSRVFHSADMLGSEIGVSCDMCHPDGSNTHPETYPKFQVQLGRTALLRDMINWCIDQAVRGEPLEADSAKMRALEAYILAQRKGEALNYGKR